MNNGIQEEPRARRARRRGGPGPTLADVARLAGVSPMTVSRVVNDSARITQASRDKVEQAIRDLGYVPNQAARSLAGARQHRLALVYENPSAAFLSELLLGCLEQAGECDAVLLLESFRADEEVTDLVARLQRHRVEGVLLPAPLCDDSTLVDGLAAGHLAVARIAATQAMAGALSIGMDDEAAARDMTSHLLALGHRRIGFIAGSDRFPMSARRRAGFCRAMQQANLAADPAMIATGDYTFRSGMEAAQALLASANPPSAIFASNDDMAAGAMATAHRLGLEVPRALSICGFDDTAMARAVWPELTTVRQPVSNMAREATILLVRYLASPAEFASHDLPDLRLGHEIVVRASTTRHVT